MPYTQNSFGSMKQSLANRLDDPQKSFWSDTELGILIQDSIRFWNCLTGEFRAWYDLHVFPSGGYGVGGYGLGGYGVGVLGAWYDLQAIVGSPRQCTLTDVDIYTRLQLALLEPISPNAALTTKQFQTSDLVQAVQRKRDEFLFRTGCTSSIELLNVNPNTETVQLPQSVIATKRAYWLPIPQASPTTPQPLPRTDEAQQLSYDVTSPITLSGDPYSFSAGVVPPLTLSLYPPPGFPGQVEVITYESQAALNALVPTIFNMPGDFVQAIMWGALADLLDMNMVAKDSRRATYARMRFEQFIQLVKVFPSVLAARNIGVPMSVDAVETLDMYEPNWRTTTDTPSVVGLSGQNLLAFPTPIEQLLSLFVVGNATIPVNDGDFVQLGDEVLDAILDNAQHVGQFKQGAMEVEGSMPLLKSILDLAASRNNKLLALSTFKIVMQGREQREDQLYPQEVEA